MCTTGVRSLRCLRSKIDSTTDLFSGNRAYKGQSWKKAEIFFIQNFIQNFIQDQFTANKMTEDSESNAEKGVVVINGNGNSSTANTNGAAAAEKPDTTTETQKQQLQPTGGSTKKQPQLKKLLVVKTELNKKKQAMSNITHIMWRAKDQLKSMQ